ncbi:MAG: hypothetical protein WBZ51_00005, partial [Xanthobacteraceae bacterium]
MLPSSDVGSSGATDILWARLLQDYGSLTPWEQFTVKDPMMVHCRDQLGLPGNARLSLKGRN